MAVIALVKHGNLKGGLAAASRALKSWNYCLVKSRTNIVHEHQSNAFAIVDLKSGELSPARA
jgi:hypothetical protein